MKRITVIAAAMIRDGKILIAKRSEGKSAPGKWELPGGTLEVGETEEACLSREIEEELGVIISVDNFLAENYFDYKEKSIRLRAYYVTYLSGEFRLSVHSEIKWVSKDELPNYDFAAADIPIVEKLIAGI